MAEPPPDDGPGVPEWVVTYGDMMSLLLTFFIMLVSMSELKSDKGAVRAALDADVLRHGPTQGQMAAPGKSLQLTSANQALGSKGGRSEGGVEKGGSDSKGLVGAHKTVEKINHGTLVTLGGAARFERFDADLNDEIKKSLDIVARVVAPKPNRLMVRGHASPEPLPPGSPFSGQMELSYVRAQQVAEYLVAKGIDRRRLVVSAAGKSEQRHRSRKKGDQRFNRRVDVFLIDSYISSPHSSDQDG